MMREPESVILAKCLNQESNCILLNVEVKPGSKKTEIRGVDEWRECIEIAVRERAERGSANQELVRFLSSLFSLPSNQITIVKGERSRKKSIRISGLTKDELVLALENEIKRRKSLS
jgi:uncharacterized protein (TIGR00251 family)